MNTRDSGEGVSRRGLLFLSFLIGTTAILLFGVVLLRRDDPDSIGQPSRRSPEDSVAPAPSARRDPMANRPVAVPTAEASPVQIELAMDQSNARALLQTLMEAAAAENPPLKDSMANALARYGRSARSLIQEELHQATSPAVRKALEEALSRAY